MIWTNLKKNTVMNTKNDFLARFPLANYRYTNIPDYAGNPLIEALPVFQSNKEVYELLRQKRTSHNDLKLLTPQDRQELIYLAREFFKPHSQVMYLYSVISSMIRIGYVNRNPLRNGYFPSTVSKFNEQQTDNTNYNFQSIPQGPFKSLGQTIIGNGGTGKTLATESILSRVYQQVIIHQNYRGQSFPFIQIVWIKVNCPVGGTVKGVCQSILLEIDSILGTTYFQDYKGNKTILMNAVSIACRNHGIGLIVIDEIQNLNIARGQDRDEILDFYTALENVKGTPIVKIGTPKARKLFDRLHTARRAVGPAPLYWTRMREDQEWLSFCEALWEMQYTDQHCPLSTELSHLLYDASQGILDFAVKAFLFAQLRAIHNGLPMISAPVLTSVVYDHFKAAETILAIFRNQDPNEVSQIDDIMIDDVSIDFDEHSQQIINETVSYETKSENQIDFGADKGSSDRISKTKEKVQKPKKGTASNRHHKVTKKKDQAKSKKAISELKSDDLRAIASGDTGDSNITYDALKSAGYIKSASEFSK
jgi:hypothetical protein